MITTAEKAITVLHESVFWSKNDSRWAYLHQEAAPASLTPLGLDDSYFPTIASKGHEINMARDSYIWCFTGVRGSGKSISMTYSALLCAWKYGLRLISNYPIECRLVLMNGKSHPVQAEELDLYKLLCFDNEYHDCLILIDEAPDVISHMAAMTWKNRLLNIFVRQLRKNHNSLFLGAQQFELIDKSMRWQTDILAECNDASRQYGWGTEHRGKCILLKLKDNSGMWTGKSYDTAVFLQRQQLVKAFVDPALKMKIYPRVLWGDENHKPVYDTYYIQDVWESLKKVDIKLMSYSVGKDELTDSDYIKKASGFINEIMRGDNPTIESKVFYKTLELNTKEKSALSKQLPRGGMERFRDNSKGSWWFSFANFNMEKFQTNDGGAEVPE